MKVKVIGSHLCPDTLYALNRLSAADAEIDFVDILSCHNALKTFLHIRETSDLYKDIRGTSRIGVPCFVLEDGSMTMDLDKILG